MFIHNMLYSFIVIKEFTIRELSLIVYLKCLSTSTLNVHQHLLYIFINIYSKCSVRRLGSLSMFLYGMFNVIGAWHHSLTFLQPSFWWFCKPARPRVFWEGECIWLHQCWGFFIVFDGLAFIVSRLIRYPCIGALGVVLAGFLLAHRSHFLQCSLQSLSM